jgi:bifunctional UDP-N-acetylglucosamine pyrophosphorylase / glucosamine-1-phosphate N-acetyltransferase
MGFKQDCAPMNVHGDHKVLRLIEKGATILAPESVFIGEEVDLDRIAGGGLVIYPGCRIVGRKTLIMPGVQLGAEAPVTLEDCCLGPQVVLKGGFFCRSCFFQGAAMGSAAQVREGCLLEEQACGAHAVGLKHTILFPYVTLGSLINFCDCFMAGGTSRSDHSEVGSSYIHFNYTANQDKATASLIGDVPQGVMLDQPPIFLGGQGGVVGPLQIAFGTVIGAGVICRRDLFDKGKLVLAQGAYDGKDAAVRRVMDFSPGVYCQIKQKVLNNVAYIGNLIALRHWYEKIRSPFFTDDLERALFEGALAVLDRAFQERLKRFKAFADRMPRSSEGYRQVAGKRTRKELFVQKDELSRRWPELEAILIKGLEDPGDPSKWEPFAKEIGARAKEADQDWLRVIHGLENRWKVLGTQWLQGIVDRMQAQVVDLMPSFG